MYKEISKLIIFGAMPSDSILVKMSDIFKQFTDEAVSKDDLIKQIYTQIKRLLTIATDYGFDGNADTIRTLLEKSNFPNLTYLGIEDSEIQDELTAVILESKYMKQIQTLDLANGTLSDKGGTLLLEKLPAYPNIKVLDVHYHYMSEKMVTNLKALPIQVDASEPNEPDDYNGEIWMNAMLTE